MAECPRIFISHDPYFFRKRLSEILAEAKMDVLRWPDRVSITDALRVIYPRPDLLMLAVGASSSGLDLVQKSYMVPPEMPVLGMTTLDRSNLDLERLRSLGVVGLVDKTATPERIAFRVNQIVRAHSGSTQRRDERAPVYFPVDLVSEGITTTEYATSLSSSGMGILSERRIELGDVELCFRLPSSSEELIESRGCVVYCTERTCEAYLIGLFFNQIDPTDQNLVSREVTHTLNLCGAGTTLGGRRER